MKTRPEAITLDEAITSVQDEPTSDVLEWQLDQLTQRHREADEGRFASSEAVKAVIRKFVPKG